MKPTDIGDPNYFHKVVDCQWACPAHTPVPEYIRLIAQGRYSDAYMINWKSNVFPGILGRTCDRPCEPACRRGRVEEQPVAICRLKRVAADYKDDVSARMPKKTRVKNGKRVALVGGGPASLTVARDLAPLGYDCVVFDGDPKAGGMMRTQIPKFRLPDSVIDEETGYILDLGVEFRGGQRVDSMKALLNDNFDAIFVGSGAPRGRDLDIPGRKEAAKNIHIGIDWLSIDRLRAHRQDRQARDRARRRQHRDGLLPLGASPRRRERAGGGAVRLRRDEGLAVGEGRRPARGHSDPQFPGAEVLHP
jgi:formate dehydrogenase beta subunit